MAKRTHAVPAVRWISVQDYKGIDEVELELPAPEMAGDPDVFVIGSENGLGKTSILECCSLLFAALMTTKKRFPITRFSPLDIPDMMIRAGCRRFALEVRLSLGRSAYDVSLDVSNKGLARLTGDDVDRFRQDFDHTANEEVPENLVETIVGFGADPVVTDAFLLFHSYRKIREGNPELGMMAEGRQLIRPYRTRRRFDYPPSHFKMTILRSLMHRADLFEISESSDSNTAIDRLNELLAYYAGGEISKLRPGADNTVDFRIRPNDGERDSFTFDGLSSGQKEIIATLFMIWYHTRERPCVVLIDEPELHLNAQWHRSFVSKLLDLAPRNQYIIATHSADVMDSVEPERRAMLSS